MADGVAGGTADDAADVVATAVMMELVRATAMATMVPAAPTAAVTVRVALLVGDGTHSTTPGKQCQQSGIVQGARPEGAWLFGSRRHASGSTTPRPAVELRVCGV